MQCEHKRSYRTKVFVCNIILYHMCFIFNRRYFIKWLKRLESTACASFLDCFLFEKYSNSFKLRQIIYMQYLWFTTMNFRSVCSSELLKKTRQIQNQKCMYNAINTKNKIKIKKTLYSEIVKNKCWIFISRLALERLLFNIDSVLSSYFIYLIKHINNQVWFGTPLYILM